MIYCALLLCTIYYKNIKEFVVNMRFKKAHEIEFSGFKTLNEYSEIDYEFSHAMMSIFHYVVKNNLATQVMYVDQSNSRKENEDSNPSYIVNECSDVLLIDDLKMSVSIYNDSSGKKQLPREKVILTLKSDKKNIKEIYKFVTQCMNDYSIYLKDDQSGKLYHFIYQDCDASYPNFTCTIFSDNNSPDTTNYETFDKMSCNYIDIFKQDIKRLKDIEYFKRTGNKRKKGYLFCGPPGCGKTASAIAIALEDNRHIIEVPFSRLKDDKNIEIILNTKEINKIFLKGDKILMLFDEIDRNFKDVNTEQNDSNSDSDDDDNNNKNKKNKKKETSSVNIGPILSRLDGVGSYNGIIFIATANNIESLDPAIYRDGRLDLITFDYASKENIRDVIQKYYDIILSDDEYINLPSIENKISHSSIKKYMEMYEHDYKKLLDYLNKLKIQ